MLKWRASIYVFVIAFFFFSLTNVSAALSDGLVTYYNFDETSGTNILDSALGRNNGTIVNVNQLNFPGILGTAMNLNGTNINNMTVADSQDHNFTNSNFSMGFWINATTDSDNNEVVEKKDATNIIMKYVWNSSLSRGEHRFQFDNGTESDFGVSGGDIQVGIYQYVFMTWNGTMSVYVDGDYKNTSAYNGTLGSNNVALYFSCLSSPCNTGTTVDEFGVWNRTLSSTEISELYNSGLGKNPFGISLTRNSPADAASFTNSTREFNTTLTPALNSLTNSTLYVWYGNGTLFNSTFSTITGSVANDSLVTIYNLLFGNYSWNVEGCDTSTCFTPPTNFTFTRTELSFDSLIWVNTTYGTSQETFEVNFTYDSSFTSTSASLIYNGTSYAGTQAGSGNTLSFSRSLTIPGVDAQQNKSFYWAVSLTNSSGISMFNSSVENQTINTSSLSICGGAGGNIPYLNFTFKDEGDSSALNASLDLADFTYWLSGGSETQSYIITNSTAHGSYAFCFDPPDKTVTTDLNFKYSFTGYPIRTFQLDDQALTNTTTNQVLYLLATADGIYSTIQTSTSLGSPITGVSMVVERQFSGVWTVIGAGVGGSDGSATFWVNPNFNHRITATKTGYTSAQVTILPSQSTYTLVMSETTSNASYATDISGVQWRTYPAPGPIQIGSHNFNVTVTSAQSNLENCKFELINVANTSQVLATSTSFTNSTYCMPSFDYTVIKDLNFFGRLSIDTTSTTGFVIVDTDWKWIALDIDNKAWRNIGTFFSDLRDLSEFGEGNERDFSRFVFFFLLSTIFLSVFFHFSGFELSNPGASLLIILFIVLLASVGGFLTFNSGSDNINSMWEQYGFLLIFSLFTAGYMANRWRKEDG